MNQTVRQTLALVVLLPVLGGTAFADTYIRGTQASYSKEIDKTTKANTSNIFVDEANDVNNKNFAQFMCQDGAALFFLNSEQPLVSQKQYDDETTPDMVVKVDSAAPVKLYTVTAQSDDKPNLKGLALDDKFDAQMLRMFQNAKSKIVIAVTRYDNRTLNFTFYPKGFNEAFKAVNNCQ